MIILPGTKTLVNMPSGGNPIMMIGQLETLKTSVVKLNMQRSMTVQIVQITQEPIGITMMAMVLSRHTEAFQFLGKEQAVKNFEKRRQTNVLANEKMAFIVHTLEI